MKKGTCLFVTARDAQNNRRTFSCGSNEDVEACLGRPEQSDDDDENDTRNVFQEMDLPEGTYFVKVTGYVVTLYGIDQDQNLWVWDFFEQENELLDDSAGDGKIKKVTWLSERSLRVLDIDCGQHGAIIKTEDADGIIKYYSILEKRDEQNENDQKEMIESLGGASMIEESTNTCLQQINVKPLQNQRNMDSTFALSEKAMFILQDVSDQESKLDSSKLIHFYKNQQ